MHPASASEVRLRCAGLQLPGILDELYTYEGPLGARVDGSGAAVRLWAPTAQQVIFCCQPLTNSRMCSLLLPIRHGCWQQCACRGAAVHVALGDMNKNVFYSSCVWQQGGLAPFVAICRCL